MLKKLFGFDPTKTTVRTELLAGLTTFLTMSYILCGRGLEITPLSQAGICSWRCPLGCR